MGSTERVFLGLGSNIGDRSANLERAYRLIDERCGEIVSQSSIYETDPVEFLDQPAFLNSVLEINPGLPPIELMTVCQAIETELGRTRAIPKGPRTLDIDLLLFGQRIIDIENPIGLVVPHPAMHLRRFVLEPFSEIAADIIHPTLQVTIRELLSNLSDNGRVTKLTG